MDVPGQTGPLDHANLAFRERPHGIVIFLDLTAPLTGASDRASSAYLKEFFGHPEMLWRSSGKPNRRLRSLILVLNKRDRAKPGVEAKGKAACGKIAREEFRVSRGAMTSDVAILPCVLVTNPDKTKLVDEVVIQLAKDLSK